MNGCLNDVAFGPTVQGCRGNFDFTLKFETVVLDLLPASIFIALSLLRIAHLVRRPVTIKGTLLRVSKTVSVRHYGFYP